MENEWTERRLWDEIIEPLFEEGLWDNADVVDIAVPLKMLGMFDYFSRSDSDGQYVVGGGLVLRYKPRRGLTDWRLA